MKALPISRALALLLLTASSLWAAPGPQGRTPAAALRMAVERGEISYDTYALQIVRAIYGKGSEELLAGMRCATSILSEIRKAWDRLSPETQEEIMAITARPQKEYSYASPSGNFLLHYDLSGEDAVSPTDSDGNGVSDYIDRGAAYADFSWSQIVGALGYHAPPSDNGEGGSNAYDIYFERLGGGLFGYVSWEEDGPNPWNDRTSYMVLNTNYQNTQPNNDPDGDAEGAFKATTAHEFFHSVQGYYDAFESGFIAESSSTWIEDVVYDETDDYVNFLYGFLSFPHQSLEYTNSAHEYGAALWHRFLTRKYETAFVREVWEGMIGNPNWFQATQAALGERSSSVADAFAEFITWNYFTGARADDRYYEAGEAEEWEEIAIVRSHDTYPVSDGDSRLTRPDHLAANYIEFLNNGESGNLSITFDGDGYTDWAVSLFLVKNDTDITLRSMEIDHDREYGEIVVEGFEQYEKVGMVAGTLLTTGSSFSYDYTATLDGQTPEPGCAVVPGREGSSLFLSILLLGLTLPIATRRLV